MTSVPPEADDYAYEIDRGLVDLVPWRIQVALFSALIMAAAFLLSSFIRGSEFTFADVTFDLMLSSGFGYAGQRGLRRSPRVIRRRLEGLFVTASEPDLVLISEVVAETGEADEFAKHRILVDRFMRSMITREEFYGAFRSLIFGHRLGP